MGLLGTIVGSKIVQGNSDIDTYGSHLSILGTGGYQEFLTIALRNAIPVDALSRIEDDGLSSGRRRLGMLCYVAETDLVYKLTIPYATWTGYTDSQKVSELANNSNWSEFTSGSGGDSIKKRYYEPAHNFQVGEVIAYNGTSYVRKLAAAGNPDETLGVISRIDDVDNFTITYAGFFDTSSMSLSGNTVYYVSATIPGGLTPIPPSGLGQENRPILITQTPNIGVVVQYRGQIISDEIITGGTGTTYVAGVIGPAEDGSYTDGLFTDFIPSTPTGTAVDRFNEVLKALAPPPAPNLTFIGKSGSTLNGGNLSFGVTRNTVGYTNVSTAAGNTAVDINGAYLVSGTRLGITNSALPILFNGNVTGNTSHVAGAFNEGDKGRLEVYLNNVLVQTIPLSASTGTLTNSRYHLSAVSAVTFSNGNPLSTFKYRTGYYNFPVSAMTTGFNYARVFHVKTTGTLQTNYVEWVYDSNANALSASATSFSGLTLTGSRYISGVRYNTGGTVSYNVTVSNAYRNTYANGNAISYPSRFNLSDAGNISKSGTGVTFNSSTSRQLPALNAVQINPQNTPVKLLSTHVLQNNILGILGNLGKIETNISVLHPFKAALVGATVSSTGFLQYATIQAVSLKQENFTGEGNRLQNRNYSALTYANINSGTYAWDSTQSLVGIDAQHNTGLLVFNGELVYPNAAYLNSQYGINNGNFSSIANGLAGNPNYSTAAGVREYSRRFTSANAVTQSTLTLEILHTGTNSSFLTDGSTGGTATGNFIKIECMIKRSGGATHGYFNPFASTGNPEGIANTNVSTIAGGTSVTCTLSTIPRIGNGDIVIVRVKAASGWTNRISNINVVNI